MSSRHFIAAAVMLLGLVPLAQADEAKLTFGGDQFSAGQTVVLAAPVAHDAFAAGYDTSLTAPVTGNAHLAGYSVRSSADVAGDLYAAGFSVTVTGGVGGNVTAIGNIVSLTALTSVPGNVRLGGSTVTLNTPVGGSALITAQTLTLDAPITGDLRFYGESLVFGPNAKVTGQVLIQAPKEIPVPENVASADRVSFVRIETLEPSGGAAKTFEGVGAAAGWTAVIWLLLLVLIGAAFIGTAPRSLAATEQASQTRSFRTLGIGIVALAAVVGFVPVFALTLVGIPLLPIVLLLIVIVCSLGFLAGVYFLGLRLVRGFMAIESKGRRLGVLIVSLLAATLLGMIPFIGWLITLGLLCFGLGLGVAAFLGRTAAPKAALPGTSAAAP